MNTLSKDRSRIQVIDALRGASILLMVLYHLDFSLVINRIWPNWMFFNPLLNFLQVVFACVFIAVCGFSCRYSRSNLKRGLILMAAAAVVTLVTSFVPNEQVVFGILHFLALAVLLYIPLHKIFDKIPENVQPFLYAGLFLATYALTEYLNAPAHTLRNPPHLWILGICDANFASSDYFPIFPWIFAFLFGTWFGTLSRKNRLPDWFYHTKIPVLPWIGRHTLWVYLLHQPVIYLFLFLFGFLT